MRSTVVERTAFRWRATTRSKSTACTSTSRCPRRRGHRSDSEGGVGRENEYTAAAAPTQCRRRRVKPFYRAPVSGTEDRRACSRRASIESSGESTSRRNSGMSRGDLHFRLKVRGRSDATTPMTRRIARVTSYVGGGSSCAANAIAASAATGQRDVRAQSRRSSRTARGPRRRRRKS